MRPECETEDCGNDSYKGDGKDILDTGVTPHFSALFCSTDCNLLRTQKKRETA